MERMSGAVGCTWRGGGEKEALEGGGAEKEGKVSAVGVCILGWFVALLYHDAAYCSLVQKSAEWPI
jgi:hypothetical protein